MANSPPRVYADAGSRESAYRKATDDLLFTKDFNTALEAWRDDPMETAAARFLAWVKRTSWGRWSLYCVGEDGRPAYQVNAAEDLHLDKRVISKTANYLVKRGYLGIDGKVLYPILSPVPADNSFRSDQKSPTWATFLDEWKVAHATDFQEYEVARAKVETYRKVLLSAYTPWKKQATNGGASLYKKTDLSQKEEASKQVSTIVVEEEPSLPACAPPVENQNGDATPEPSTVHKILALPEIQQLQVETGNSIDSKFAAVIAANLRDGPVEKLGQVITERKKKGRISTGLLPNLAAGVARSNDIHKQTARDKANVDALQQQVQQSALIQQLLRDWDKTPKDDQQSARDTWPEVAWPPGRRT